MTVSRLIARPMLASIFVVGAAKALKNPPAGAAKAEPVTDRLVPLAQKAGIPLPDDPETLVRLNAGVQIGAGLALATGRAPAALRRRAGRLAGADHGRRAPRSGRSRTRRSAPSSGCTSSRTSRCSAA